MASNYQMIETSAALTGLVERLADEPCVALDTEFVWETTYYARLGLVQIGLGHGECFLLDTVAVPDLTPLAAVIADPRIEKILHDAPQDLMILKRATGASARNVFDTRLAAGFAGMSSETSLQNLLKDLLGIEISKGHTCTDWLARPLSAAQLEYGADDVCHLPQAATRLREKADESGVGFWMSEELTGLNESSLYEDRRPEEAYLRIRAAEFLRPRQLAVLRELAAWRECEAIASNVPRRRIAEDVELASIAKNMPRQPAELVACHDLHRNTIRRFGDALLAAVRQGIDIPDAELPTTLASLDARPVGKEQIAAVAEQIRLRAVARKVDPRLVNTKKDILQLLGAGIHAAPDQHRLLRGWRAELLGDCLTPFLSA
jgi:ribonuclease D